MKKMVSMILMALMLFPAVCLGGTCEHDMQVNGEIPPTCTSIGWRHFICAKCGADGGAVILPALCHQWSDWETIQAQTCTECGLAQRMCERCGKTEEKTDGEALCHDYVLTDTIEPTYTDDGRETYVCSRDSNHIHYHIIPKLEKTPEPTTQPTVAPTEKPTAEPHEQPTEPPTVQPTIEPTKAPFYCEKNGHDWGNWVVEHRNIYGEADMLWHKCERCGKEEYSCPEYAKGWENQDGTEKGSNGTVGIILKIIVSIFKR